jgi:hypothetical protein
VTGTVGGTLGFQFQEVLNASETRHHTHELVASVLEAESVQSYAADFVWASLTGAENKNRGHAHTGNIPVEADNVAVTQEKPTTADAAVGTGEDLLVRQDMRQTAVLARIEALTKRIEVAERRLSESVARDELLQHGSQALAAEALLTRLAETERVLELQQARQAAPSTDTFAGAPLWPWTRQYWQQGAKEVAPTLQQRTVTGHGLTTLQQVVASTDSGSWGSVPMEAGLGDGGAQGRRGPRVAMPASDGTQE